MFKTLTAAALALTVGISAQAQDISNGKSPRAKIDPCGPVTITVATMAVDIHDRTGQDLVTIRQNIEAVTGAPGAELTDPREIRVVEKIINLAYALAGVAIAGDWPRDREALQAMMLDHCREAF